MAERAIQDQISGNHCWGCSPTNGKGLQVKSYWDGDETICTWQPQPHHMAGPTHVTNGGIIASIIDCHCICSAIAAAYKAEGRDIGAGEYIWYATGTLSVRYSKPTPIDKPVNLRARVTEMTERKTILECSLTSEGEECATAEVVAIRVPAEWRGAG